MSPSFPPRVLSFCLFLSLFLLQCFSQCVILDPLFYEDNFVLQEERTAFTLKSSSPEMLNSQTFGYWKTLTPPHRTSSRRYDCVGFKVDDTSGKQYSIGYSFPALGYGYFGIDNDTHIARSNLESALYEGFNTVYTISSLDDGSYYHSEELEPDPFLSMLPTNLYLKNDQCLQFTNGTRFRAIEFCYDFSEIITGGIFYEMEFSVTSLGPQVDGAASLDFFSVGCVLCSDADAFLVWKEQKIKGRGNRLGGVRKKKKNKNK